MYGAIILKESAQGLGLSISQTGVSDAEPAAGFAEHGGIVKEGNQIRLDAARKEDWEYIIEECPSGAIRWDSIVMTVSQAAEAVMKDAPFYRYGEG